MRIIFCLLIVAAMGYTIDVDRSELEIGVVRDIEFLNYEGAHDVIDSIEEIRAIGLNLGEGDGDLDSGRYEIIHAIEADSAGRLNADIFIVHPESRVDHIDNLRRIIGGYLESAYGYSLSDANLLAELVTIYNAIYRGILSYFEERYSPAVLASINAETVGLSVVYSDWPGGTRIVIPLAPDPLPSTVESGDIVEPVAAVDALQLTQEGVIEELRQEEDRGIETRREAVELIEETIDRRQERIDLESALIEGERIALETEERDIAERLAAIAKEREALAQDGLTPDEVERIETLARRFEELQLRVVEVEQRSEEIVEREERVEQEEERVRELTEAVREQRESIAIDTQEILEERDSRGRRFILFPLLRRSNDVVYATIAQVDSDTGEIFQTSAINTITSRGYISLDADLLVIADYNNGSRLVILDDATLRVMESGEHEIFPASSIAVEEDDLYAVFESDNQQWLLGRFDPELRLRARTEVPVDPLGFVIIERDRIFVQDTGGAILRLDRTTLK